ncbi:Pentatricopeptide repeat-containing protein [Abeliophyllum distichum]|uniref:Pentatricopeptide repeat-containing protein n=1 Tax=Abeliophyllum distichum TaxID=126358 RepID=A0ABD1RBT0_9LAMI
MSASTKPCNSKLDFLKHKVESKNPLHCLSTYCLPGLLMYLLTTSTTCDMFSLTPTTPALRPLTPLLHDFLHQRQTTSTSVEPQNLPSFIHRTRRHIGKPRDPNKGKLWSHHRLSPQGEFILQSLIDPQFNIEKFDEVLLNLCNSCDEEMGSSELSIETICFDVLSIIKALGFYKKCDLAPKMFEWVRNRPDSDKLVNRSAVAVIISMWGKKVSNRRYMEAVMVFKKMEEEGCKPTLISINGEGLVADYDGFPVTSVGTSTTCCRRHLVFHGGGGGLRRKNCCPWGGCGLGRILI